MLVVFLLKIGLLSLLWLFVLAAVLVVRRDLVTARPRPARGRPARGLATGDGRRPKPPKGAPRRLVVTQGRLVGTSVPLGDLPVTIGRAQDSTLVLTDDYVSSRHARLVQQDGGWLVEDMGSTNGTYLDRQKVTGPTPVGPGVPIRIGKTVLELRR